MSNAEPVMIVSVDGHGGPPVEQYREYLETGYEEWFDALVLEEAEYVAATSKIGSFSAAQLEVIDGAGAIASGGLDGAWDIERRLAEMDREGIAAEVFLQGHQAATSPFFAFQNRAYPADVRMAGVRAYHRWLADRLPDAGGRLIAVAENTPHPDLQVVLDEVRWAAEQGFRATMFPGALTDPDLPLPPYHDPYWEPFWATCAELDLALVLHVGVALRQGVVFERFQARAETSAGDYDRNAPQPTMMEDTPNEDDLFALDYSPRRALWELMIGGVFDRHPGLHYVPTEARADWVPATLARMDARFERGDTPLRRRPSEYWSSNCFAGASFIHRAEIEIRDQIGASTLMFGRDYPHPEGTWPNTGEWLRAAFRGVAEPDARAILGTNAIRCFGLDAGALRKVADRVGPSLDDIVDGPDVDAALVTEFHKRGGFEKPVPDLQEPVLDRIMDRALTATG